MYILTRKNRVIAHCDAAYYYVGSTVVCPKTGESYQDALIVNTSREIPADIDCREYDYISGEFIRVGVSADIHTDDAYQELIFRSTFEELDFKTKGTIPAGKPASGPYREMTIPLNGDYEEILVMTYFAKQSKDSSNDRDCQYYFQGQYGGLVSYHQQPVMSNDSPRYSRFRLYREKGLWYLEILGATESRSTTSAIRYAPQSGYGASNERIDAELGIVDPTHLGKYEGVDSLRLILQLSHDGSKRINPDGAITVYGVKNSVPANIKYYSVTTTCDEGALSFANKSYAGQTVYVDIKDTTKIYKVVDMSGNTIQSTTSTESYQYSGAAFKQLKFTMPAEDVEIVVSGESTCEHNWDSGVTTSPATCISEGVKKFTCTLCGATKTESTPIDPDAHQQGDNPWEYVDDYGCHYQCILCGDYVGYSSHSDSDGDGYCDYCGGEMPHTEPDEPDTPDEPEHVHEYTKVVTEPTCTEQGYTTYTCKCGHSYTDDYVDALGHIWQFSKDGMTHTAKCSRCEATETHTVKAEYDVEINSGDSVYCYKAHCTHVMDDGTECDIKSYWKHDLATEFYDDNRHRVYCQDLNHCDCTYSYLEDHDYDEWGNCKICGYQGPQPSEV